LHKQPVRVVIKPDGKEVWVVSGSTVREALFAASVPISMPCGGHGRCGKCVVLVKGGVSRRDRHETARLKSRRRGARLACLAKLEGNAEVTIPPSSRVSIQKIAGRGRVSRTYRFGPGLIKVFLGKKRPADMRILAQDYGIGIEDIAMSITNPNLMEDQLRMDHEWRLGLHANATLVATKGEIIALIKPQFEAEREQVGKGGVVRDPAVHRAVLEKITAWAMENRLRIRGLIPSPLKGPAGNLEFFAHLSRDEYLESINVEEAITSALTEAEAL